MQKNLRIIVIIIFITLVAIAGATYVLKNKDTSKNTNEIVKASQKKQENKSISDDEKEKYLLKNNYIEKYGEIPFNVYSDGSIVFDVETGQILYQKLPDLKAPTASISKIMTAIIVLENSKLDKEITVSKNAAEQIPNSMDLVEGETLTVKELLYGLMKLSANDAAFALAEGTLGLDNFVKKMNEKATWLELKNTNFQNPAGLDDPTHKSTAHDLAVITRYGLQKYPEILEYMGPADINIQKTDKHEAHYIYHVSDMIKSYAGMDGAKTGYTWDAGHTFIGTAKRDGKRLAVVVFNSQSAMSDIQRLLDHGFQSVKKPL